MPKQLYLENFPYTELSNNVFNELRYEGMDMGAMLSLRRGQELLLFQKGTLKTKMFLVKYEGTKNDGSWYFQPRMKPFPGIHYFAKDMRIKFLCRRWI